MNVRTPRRPRRVLPLPLPLPLPLSLPRLLLLAAFLCSTSSGAPVESSSELSSNHKNHMNHVNHVNHMNHNAKDAISEADRALQSSSNTASTSDDPMPGSCTSSTLGAGQQRPVGSYLCYPPPSSSSSSSLEEPISKFGIDVDDRLSYYVRDVLVWRATPAPDESSTACIVFGTCDPAFSFFRLQNGGSLAGYSSSSSSDGDTNGGRVKIWDSHDGAYHDEATGAGEYYYSLDDGDDDGGGDGTETDNVLGEPIADSRLEVTEEGVFVIGIGADGAEVVTWKIVAPEGGAPTASPVVAVTTEGPTRRPTNPPTNAATGAPTNVPTNVVTSPPTNKPTNVVITSAPTNAPTNAATNPSLGTIQGFVWDDTPTNDAIYSRSNSGSDSDAAAAQDVGMANVPISLHRCADDVFLFDTATDADGTFEFENLIEGSYRVRVTSADVEEGYYEFVDKNVNDAATNGTTSRTGVDSDANSDGSTDCIVVEKGGGVSSGGGGGSTSADGLEHSVYVGMIRNHVPVTVSGRVFRDVNANGLDDDDVNGTSTEEPSLENIVVDIYDCDDEFNWVSLTRTDGSGAYRFVAADDVAETEDLTALFESMGVTRFRGVFSGLPEGYEFGPYAADQTSDYAASDVFPMNGYTPCWDLELYGKTDIVWNAGITKSSSSTTVEVGTPSIKPTSRPTTANQPTTTTTTSRPTSKPSSSSSTTAPTAAAGTGTGIIGGYGFFDADDNGVRHPDLGAEPAVPDVNVRLYSCTPGSTTTAAAAADDDDDNQEFLAIASTDGQGLYVFRNLAAGYYRVAVQPPAGYSFSPRWIGRIDDEGTFVSPDADSTVDPDTGDTPCFELMDGDTDTSWGFGLNNGTAVANGTVGPTLAPTLASASDGTEPASSSAIISGFVFDDKDDNGYFDEETENAMSDVQVALFDCQGNILLLSTTDVNGLYGFSDLEPGSYSVKFSFPKDYDASSIWSGLTDDEGTLVAPDAESDVDPNTGSSPCTDYGAGENDYSLDAGMHRRSDGDGESESESETAASANQPTFEPTPKPTPDVKGDGTPCSGGPCPDKGFCRNKAGVCGTGLSFCNPQSAWTPDCPPRNEEDEESPLETTDPTVADDVSTPSSSPSASFQPSISISPSGTSVATTTPTSSKQICNPDGSFGNTRSSSANANDVVANEVTFTYAIQSDGGLLPRLVSQFETELNRRLACDYFSDPCMNCQTAENVRLRGRLLHTTTASRSLAVEGSSVAGLSSDPPDEFALELCADPRPGCQVMTGIFTSYFPAGTDSATIDAETEQMLAIVSEELAQDNWNGMTLSYANEPFGQPSAIEKIGGSDDGGDDGGVLSTGAIIGIAVAGFVVVAAVIIGIVLIVRGKRNKNDALQHPRTVPYGNAEQSQPKLEEDDSDSDESSSIHSSEDDDDDDNTGVLSAPSAVSEDNTFSTFKTTMAQAQRQDIEEDDSSNESSSGSDDESSSSNSSGSQSSGPKSNDLNQLQKSDEDHVYVPDDDFIDEYDRSADDRGYGDRKELVAYPNSYNDREFEAYTSQKQATAYRKQTSQGSASSGGSRGSTSRSRRSKGSMGSTGSQGSMGSANSADPPGTSYRDLPASDYDEWGNPPPHHYNDETDPYDHPHEPVINEYVSQPPDDGNIYEKNSMGSSDQNMSRGSINSRDSHRSNENGESHHSFHEGDNRHFNDSYRSQHSHRSLGSRGSLHHSFEKEDGDYNRNVPGQVTSPEGSFHSFDENDDVYNGRSGDYDDGDYHGIGEDSGQYDDSHYNGEQFNGDPYYDENQHESRQYNPDQYREKYNNAEYHDGRYMDDQYNREEQYQDQYQERHYDDGDQFKGESFDDIHYDRETYTNDDQYPDGPYNSDNHRDDHFSGDYVEKDQYPDDRYNNDRYEDSHQNRDFTDDDAYHRSPLRSRQSGKDSKSFHSEDNDDDEYDAHSRNRPVTTPTETLFKEEELDEQIDDATHTTNTSYGTQVTERASNLTSAAQYHPVSSPMPEKEALKPGNPSPSEVYDEEEESIDNIFKSLSEIQTRLASKGKGKGKTSDSKKSKINKNSSPMTTPKEMYRSSSHSGSNGWEQDGIVEDASEDGSRASTFAANAARNRRPRNGQWMEPVEEDDD